MATTYTINQEHNGIEIKFDGKPSEEIREELKAANFRWHKVKKVWYAKRTGERLEIAERIAEKDQDGKREQSIKTGKATTEQINLENLGGKAPSLYGAELAAAIREDLKKRGVKGVTVRSRRVTHETGITVTVKATSADIVSIEEYKKRYPFENFVCDAESCYGVFDGKRCIYESEWSRMTEEERRTAYNNSAIYNLTKAPSFNQYHHERDNMPTLTTDFYNKVVAVFRIANQWNWNHSDSMTDYYDVGYYLDIDIKIPQDIAPAEEMTEEQRTTYETEKATEKAAREERLRKFVEEEAKRQAQHEAYEKQRKADIETINNDITIEDIEEGRQIYITNLIGGYGKESNLDELREAEKGRNIRNDAIITRKVTFTTEETFKLFTRYLLDDFEWLSGMGGTASEDVRLEGVKNLFALNTQQRESVKWYCCNCIGIYVENQLRIVSNPEGYNYSRYTYEPTPESEIFCAQAETERQKTDSKGKTPFYFPAPIEDQICNLHTGQKITVYQTDGWNLCSIYGGCGTIEDITLGTYAQYSGAYIRFTNRKSVFVQDDKKTLIYPGIMPPLPDELIKKRISENTYLLLNSDEIFPLVIDYYNREGISPIVDTIQR